MRLRLMLALTLAVLVGACQELPIFVVVTATPDPTEIVLDLTRDAAVTLVAQAQGTLQPALPTQALPTPAPTTAAPTVTQPTAQPANEPTPLPAGFPTPVVAQITVAEQLFEGGRMFWIQPTGQLWVMIVTSEGRGTWTIYEDNYVDGEPETDPSLVPPEGRYQPERGFGKLWREAENLREILGWGVTPEFGYVSRYEYHAGGSVDPATGTFTPGPGYHILFSLGGELFRFNETDGTWQLGND